jgi:hypothetical protein
VFTNHWKSVRELDAYDAYLFGLLNSLIPAKNSLFFEIFSLLICVGNCAKSDCGAAVSCYEIGLGSPEIAKFPVKFPVSREFAWRRVRSALRRQPGSPEAGNSTPQRREKPAVGGLFQFRAVSELPNWRIHRPFREKSPATTANIPVFGRLSLETGFDLHCVRVEGSISLSATARLVRLIRAVVLASPAKADLAVASADF